MKQQNESQRAPITVKEAAEELGISETIARTLISDGRLTAYRPSSRKIVVYREDLETFKQSRRVAALNTKEAS